MSSTTNWGDVTLDIIEKMGELVNEGKLRQVQFATEEEIAAYAPKGFPAAAVVWRGTSIQKPVTLQANQFYILERGNWEIHHYASSGATDASAAFKQDGPFVLSVLSREKLLGFMPGSQISNSYLLHKDGDGSIERFAGGRGGSGGMKVVVPYYMDQMICAVGA